MSINTSQASQLNVNQTTSPDIKMGFVERFLMTWKAKLFLFIGKRDIAAGIFRMMLAKEPNNAYVLNSLAYDALLKKNLVLAHQYFEKVIALQPQLSNSHFNLAFVASDLDRLVEAEQGFREAIKLEEKMDRAWYGLGLVLVRQRRFEESIEAFKRNTQLQPMSPYAWYQMARVHMELAQTNEARMILSHLNGFEPKVAKQLARETGLKIEAY
jgi:Tfp pilus assembly protein PilF